MAVKKSRKYPVFSFKISSVQDHLEPCGFCMKTFSTSNETSKCPEKDYFYSKSELSQTFLLQLHRLDL